jgi:starch synthase (maltosyl-transferring)
LLKAIKSAKKTSNPARRVQRSRMNSSVVALPEEGRRRVVIDNLSPDLTPRFAIKRTPGERVVVQADVFADGHDRIAAMLRYRVVAKDGPNAWRETPMRPLVNDRWEGGFEVDEIGRYEYAVSAWVDHFASWQHALEARVAAAQEGLHSEFLEGAAILRAAVRRSAQETRPWLEETASFLESDAPIVERAERALSPQLTARMTAAADRSFASESEPRPVVVDRERARFSTWYEMFSRSAGPDPTRSATFREAAARIPEIAGMGFDVLYLAPIHPIGKTNRKGKGNTLVAKTGDPGSPWAIGGEEGGHTAVEPGLGTIDDFRWFREQAEDAGLEIALDLAYQASPDHPYTREHPEWFRHRPDGTLKYAENPPKKYQDIYPFNFESDAWPPLWIELRDVVLFWVEQGVRIFRVDNPHTKPFAFWEWLIADVQARDPGVIFLSEAFTRPKIMRWLAKLGFTQSYTYFTWRNTKLELEEYFTELTQTEMREYFRPNLFANTPDILHAFLQQGGPGAFRIRLLLAATLGATYGIYSGFELCENRPAGPGSEEYLDSEKYQFRSWDFAQPGSLSTLIARVNAIRHEHAALKYNDGLRFHLTTSDDLIAYSKTAPYGGPRIFTVVSLQPHEPRDGWVCLSLPDAIVADGERYVVRDLLTDRTYTWSGAWNYVKLDPSLPAHIFLVEPSSVA